MRLSQLYVEWEMTGRKLVRNRMAIALLFVIPTLFYAIIVATTTEGIIPIELAQAATPMIQVPQEHEALVFVGLASVGLLTSFVSLNVIQKNSDVNQRLVLCGYRPSEIVASKLLAVACVVAVVSAYVAGILYVLFSPERFALVVVGFALGGWIYACYGLLIGALFRRDLVGILFIVLLANIDVGWLQNPIHYAASPNKWLVRILPGHFPSQIAMLGSFTADRVGRLVGLSLVYGTVLLLIAMAIFTMRMRIRRR